VYRSIFTDMGPHRHGNSYLPFVDLIALEKVDDTTFRSTAPPFSPNEVGRAYGGHVYAQAVWAAAQTVKAGFVIHVSTQNTKHD
jgi:acyl-CoA thioesterase